MKKVLIADDNTENRYFLEILLRGHGFEASMAENGQEALEMAQAHPPDLIVSDILMPVMDGYTLCRQCKSEEQLKNIPFVFYTATYTDPKDEKFALSLGADRFILKPQEPGNLINILTELLEEKHRVKPVPPKPLGEEMEFFRGHNESLFRKLEKKMVDLETANQKLKILEERYRLSFENVSDVIYTIDTDFNFLNMSPSVKRILGYEPEDFIGRSVSDMRNFLTPESFERAIADTGLILKGETISGAIYEFVAQDGEIKFGEVSGSPLMRDGKIIGLISVARDITDRKRMEEALKENEERYRMLFSNMFSGVAVYETKDNGNTFIIKELNKGGEAIEQVKKEDILGQSVADVFPGIKEFGLFDVFQRVWKTGKPEHYPIKLYKDVRINGWRDNFVYKLPSGEIVTVYTDETQRKQAEEAIEISLTKYQTLFETLPVGVTISDKAGNILESNKEAEQLLGLPRREQTERMIDGREWRIIRPDGSPMPAEEYASVRALKENCLVENVEMGLVKGEGEVTWINVTAAPVPLEDYGVVIVYSDITERKQVEEKLRESEKKYHELYDFLPIPVYEMDLETNITSANRAIFETFRGTEEDLKKGFKGWQLLSLEEIEKSSQNIQRLLKGEPVEGSEYTLMRLDGSVFPAIVISSVIYRDGKPVGLRGAVVDITERKRAEKSLQESDERYKALFDGSLDLVYITDFEGGFIDANAAALNRLGYTREEIPSLNFASLLSEDQLSLALKTLQDIRGHGIQMGPMEFRLRHKNGSEVYVETQGSTVMSSGTPVAIQAIARDITERKKAEEKLSQTMENLRKTLGGIIQVISDTVEARDPYTAGHQRRVTDLAQAITRAMGLSDDQRDGLQMAGTIHDLGKISIPAEILSKPTKLTEIEYKLIQAHPQIGFDILKGIEFPWPIAETVLQHHERMDGSGYPRGLKGNEIFVEARILMVADVVEAMASHRPYRPALGIEAGLGEIEKNKGILYDPEVVDVCLRLFREKGFRFN